MTLNDRQDYFGQTVNIASRVQGLAIVARDLRDRFRGRASRRRPRSSRRRACGRHCRRPLCAGSTTSIWFTKSHDRDAPLSYPGSRSQRRPESVTAERCGRTCDARSLILEGSCLWIRALAHRSPGMTAQERRPNLSAPSRTDTPPIARYPRAGAVRRSAYSRDGCRAGGPW